MTDIESDDDSLLTTSEFKDLLVREAVVGRMLNQSQNIMTSFSQWGGDSVLRNLCVQ